MKIRQTETNDAEAMLSLNMKLDTESDFMLFEPSERDQSVELQAGFIKRALSQNNIIWLVAEAGDGALQGYCVISGKTQRRVKHVGNLVIGVARQYWSQGVGFSLLSAIIEQSQELGFTRLELSVRSDNQRAIALYKKVGFVEEGERKSSLNIAGKYFNELYMAKV